MGSKSDWPTMKFAADILKKLGIKIDTKIVSAHRTPKRMYDFSSKAKKNNIISYYRLIENKNLAKVSIIGIGMKTHAGVAQKMFETLSQENININVISTSEIKLSVLIERKYLELAVRSLHDAFGLQNL